MTLTEARIYWRGLCPAVGVLVLEPRDIDMESIWGLGLSGDDVDCVAVWAQDGCAEYFSAVLDMIERGSCGMDTAAFDGGDGRTVMVAVRGHA